MILTGNSDLVRITTTAATATLDIYAAWADQTSTTFTPGRTNTATSGAVTNTTIVGSPSSAQRQVKEILVKNTHASLSQTFTVNLYDGSTAVVLYSRTILAGESVAWTADLGWQPFNAAGTPVTIATSSPVDVQEFTVSGETGPWVKPTSFTPKFVQVILRGGGGGGAAMAGGGIGGAGGLGGAGYVCIISW